jgi:hypothetical protein
VLLKGRVGAAESGGKRTGANDNIRTGGEGRRAAAENFRVLGAEVFTSSATIATGALFSSWVLFLAAKRFAIALSFIIGEPVFSRTGLASFWGAAAGAVEGFLKARLAAPGPSEELGVDKVAFFSALLATDARLVF